MDEVLGYLVSLFFFWVFFKPKTEKVAVTSCSVFYIFAARVLFSFLLWRWSDSAPQSEAYQRSGPPYFYGGLFIYFWLFFLFWGRNSVILGTRRVKAANQTLVSVDRQTKKKPIKLGRVNRLLMTRWKYQSYKSDEELLAGLVSILRLMYRYLWGCVERVSAFNSVR